MGKKGRKFIDKKRDVLHTFKVVARSQRDPLAADETAPQGVLQSTNDSTQKSERQKYGIYFDDDYDYLQHLRGVREAVEWDNLDLEVYTIRNEDTRDKKNLKGKKLVLPSSAFESYVEEPIGLLNKAAPVTGPRPELDPDIVAELDDDFLDGDMCNPEDNGALPDNFVLMLNSENPLDQFDEDGEWEDCDEEDDEIWGNDGKMPALEDAMEGMPQYSKFSAYRDKGQDEGYDADEEERDFSSDFNDSDDEERDEVCSLEGPPRTFRDEETKSNFTSYSLSSSVLRRNDLLSQLDGCFEEKFLREYQDEQVGALDGEDIDGFVDEESPLFKQVMDQSRKQLKENSEEEDTRIVKWIKDMQQQRGYQKEEKEEVIVSDDEPKEKWDCESILSTYSTLYNHPRTITDPPRRKKIAVNPRTGIPVDYEAGGLTRKALAQHDLDSSAEKNGQLDTETLITSMSAISFRPAGETPEERRFRKKALKELRRERRIEKKVNRAAFKEEKKRQEKVLLNNRNNNKISLM
ncbi:protein LTV1 homolog [Penaeus japonicus]|uniref:protein LTV1 homolog n=1 Tax=Penaeus japonicus TaxID=27405 RepID=UPI001C716883|nr:protein LTV1 homolog [Penaeus japonicus]